MGDFAFDSHSMLYFIPSSPIFLSDGRSPLSLQVVYDKSTGKLYLATNAEPGATVVVTAPAGVLVRGPFEGAVHFLSTLHWLGFRCHDRGKRRTTCGS